MLDYLVSETPFAALVIIDEVPDNLEKILLTRFKFGVEVLELSYYKCSDGRKYYRFEPFLADINADLQQTPPHDKQEELISQDDIDTVVVPAREDGFQDVFLKENRWYSVRIHGTMRPQIKYIAVYQVAPQSAITYVAPVSSIEPWDETQEICRQLRRACKTNWPDSPLKTWQSEGTTKFALYQLRAITQGKR